jgi:hypothetical protein
METFRACLKLFRKDLSTELSTGVGKNFAVCQVATHHKIIYFYFLRDETIPAIAKPIATKNNASEANAN